MIHLKLQGTHHEIGRKLGIYMKENHVDFPIRLDRVRKKHGADSLYLLEKYFPEAGEEINGFLAEYPADYETFGAWLMCMGSCLTLRENHNVEVRGCTVFCFSDAGHLYYGRDNDLPPYLQEVSKSIRYQPEGKCRFLMNTSSFINGEEGINEHGLVVAMTFVIPKKEELRPGLNSVFLVRYILENCLAVEDGIQALQQLPVASSCNILLADKTGKMVVAECSPFEINIRYPEKNKEGEEFIVTVNHFSSTKMQKYDRSRQNVYFSRLRYKTACDALKRTCDADGVSFAKDLLSGKLGFMCQYRNVQFETIWSTIFDITNSKMFLAEGNPEMTAYQETTLFTD